VKRIFSIASRLVLQVMILMLFTPAEARSETGTSLSFGETFDEPITAALNRVLRTPTAAWRSPLLEVFRWDLLPEIIVIDTVDFHLQGRTFTRLAYFLEKKGFRGRLMTNAQLAGRHGWNAHDYGPDGLASFFNAAREKTFMLNPEEKALESLALREGILVPDGAYVAPGRGGAGFSRSPDHRLTSSVDTFSPTSRSMGSFSHPLNTGSSVSGSGIRCRQGKGDSTGASLPRWGTTVMIAFLQ
jgi:hypothetical protein